LPLTVEMVCSLWRERRWYYADAWPRPTIHQHLYISFCCCCLRLRNDLYCVEWGVKLYSLTHSVAVVNFSIRTTLM